VPSTNVFSLRINHTNVHVYTRMRGRPYLLN
jgi:hypothetical protein